MTSHWHLMRIKSNEAGVWSQDCRFVPLWTRRLHSCCRRRRKCTNMSRNCPIRVRSNQARYGSEHGTSERGINSILSITLCFRLPDRRSRDVRAKRVLLRVYDLHVEHLQPQRRSPLFHMFLCNLRSFFFNVNCAVPLAQKLYLLFCQNLQASPLKSPRHPNNGKFDLPQCTGYPTSPTTTASARNME